MNAVTQHSSTRWRRKPFQWGRGRIGYTDLNRDGSSQLLPRATPGDSELFEPCLPLSQTLHNEAQSCKEGTIDSPFSPCPPSRSALALTAFGAIDFLAGRTDGRRDGSLFPPSLPLSQKRGFAGFPAEKGAVKDVSDGSKVIINVEIPWPHYLEMLRQLLDLSFLLLVGSLSISDESAANPQVCRT